jgi:hypothetical protein
MHAQMLGIGAKLQKILTFNNYSICQTIVEIFTDDFMTHKNGWMMVASSVC